MKGNTTMIKIGSVTIDVSHPIGFAQAVVKNELDMRYTGVFDDGFRSREEVEKFATDNNLKIYDSLEEMADEVDVGFIHACNWEKHLDYAMPFINRGKPVFIDKPIAGSTADLAKWVELEKNGAKILGTSMLRYANEVQEIRKEYAEKGLKAAHSIVTVGVDEFNYAIHAVEEICAIHHPAHAVSTRHVANVATEGVTLDHYFVKFDDDSSAEYICGSGRSLKFSTMIIAGGNPSVDKYMADKCIQIDNSKLSGAMLKEIELALKGEPNLITTVERSAEAVRIMLAGKASRLNGDIEVDINSELVDTVSYDGYEFENDYAKKAGNADYHAERK